MDSSNFFHKMEVDENCDFSLINDILEQTEVAKNLSLPQKSKSCIKRRSRSVSAGAQRKV